MRLRSFDAKSMHDALRQVRDTLGEDAIIVTSREEKNGWVRVTAAAENPPAAAPEKLKAFDPQETEDLISDALLKHRVPGALSDQIIACVLTDSGADPEKVLARALAETLSFAPPKRARQPLILVGPPGAGKTLMTAKLAAASVLDGGKPCVITTDTARAGGVEQLSAFLDILKLPLHTAEDSGTLKQALAKTGKTGGVVIDTGGLNPFDPQEMKTLAKLIAVSDAEAALVLPAGIDAEESAEMALTFGVLGVKKLIPTRLDFARRLGGILSAAGKARLSLSIASHTPQVANGIVELSPQKLAELLLPGKAAKKQAKRGTA